MNLKFTYESRDTLRSFSLFLTVKTISKLNMEHSVKLTVENLKIRLRRSPSPGNAKFGHFTLLFCRGRKKFTKIYNAREQPLFCSLNYLFSDVLVPVAVGVFSSSGILRKKGGG